MFSDNNDEKFYLYNSSLPFYDLDFIDNLDPEHNDINDNLVNETEMFDQPINDKKNNPSETYRNASTNPLTDSIKDGPIFKITKTPKNTENSDNTDNADNAGSTSNINNTNNVNNTNNTNNLDNENNTNNTNNEYLGKKREKGTKHDKFCYDNLTRKVKSKLFWVILNFLNSSLSKKFSSKYFFLKIRQNIILDTNTIFNRELLNSTLKDIYSNKIYTKVSNYEEAHNKKLIDEIYREKIELKTISILDKTLLQCLEHFRGSKYYADLGGLENGYQNVIDEFISKGETNEYIEKFKEFLSQFDNYYFNIKKVKPKKNSRININ